MHRDNRCRGEGRGNWDGGTEEMLTSGNSSVCQRPPVLIWETEHVW